MPINSVYNLSLQNSAMPLNRVNTLLRLLFVTCFALIRLACTQGCYYPNGNPTLEPDSPCNDGTGNCCPLNWECLNNGLCYLPNEGYLQRTTCTDKNWGPTCPQICTYGKSAAGNEAILRCQSGEYCCDKNRVSGNCCTDPGFISFSLADGQVVATILPGNSNAPPPNPSTAQQSSPTEVPSATSSSPTISTQPSSPTINTPPSPSSTNTPSSPSLPSTQTFSSTSGSQPSPTSLVVHTSSTGASRSTVLTSSTSAQIPAVTVTNTLILQTPPSSTASSSNSHVAKIVAPIVSVIGGLILLALVMALIIRLRRRRLQNRLDGYYGQGHDGHYMVGYDGHYGQPYNGHYG